MATDVVLVNPLARGELRRSEHLGLGYLAAALRRAGIAVKIVDAHLLGASIPRTVELVVEAAPRAVGITVTQPQGRALVAIAAGVRSRLPRAHITAGGHFPTFCHDRLLRDVPALDLVVRGEGELVFVDMVQCILGGREWRALPGVSFRQDGAVVSNPPGPLVANLDDLAFPARDTARVALASHAMLSISSSRGCYARCTFCSVRAFYGLQSGLGWRARSPENIIEEMALLASQYGCTRFLFVDANFVGPGVKGRERAHAFADEAIGRGLRCQFAIECRANDVERDLFRHLREAGLRRVALGIESGSQTQLDRFRKGTTVEDGRRALSVLRDLGIAVIANLIMFDPDCTLSECQDTLHFIASERLARQAYGFNNTANPLDGTELCDRLREQGRLRGSYLTGYSYLWRDPTAALCAKVIAPLGRLLVTVPNPFRRRPHSPW